jgi:CRP/FNR family cyclic AMP-dependent transcriptional regulator
MEVSKLLKNDPDIVKLAPGQVLFYANEPAKALYVLVEGAVEIRLPDGQLVESAGPGTIIGELAIVDGGVRSASVVATARCHLVAIGPDRFRRMISEDPEFAIDVMKVMADRLRRMNTRLAAAQAGVYAALEAIV